MPLRTCAFNLQGAKGHIYEPKLDGHLVGRTALKLVGTNACMYLGLCVLKYFMHRTSISRWTPTAQVILSKHYPNILISLSSLDNFMNDVISCFPCF